MKRDRQATEAARFEDARSFIFKDGREFRVGYDWKVRVQELRERCGGKCEYVNSDGQRCRSEAADPHHKIKRSVARDDRLSNLQALCRYHHEFVDERKVRSDRKERREQKS